MLQLILSAAKYLLGDLIVHVINFFILSYHKYQHKLTKLAKNVKELTVFFMVVANHYKIICQS